MIYCNVRAALASKKGTVAFR